MSELKFVDPDQPAPVSEFVELQGGTVEEITQPLEVEVNRPAPAKLTPARPTEAGSFGVAWLAERLIRWFNIDPQTALDIVTTGFALVPIAITFVVTEYRNGWQFFKRIKRK